VKPVRTAGRDYVREEIAAALQRPIVVIPARFGREGQMPPLPRAEDLPEDIRDSVGPETETSRQFEAERASSLSLEFRCMWVDRLVQRDTGRAFGTFTGRTESRIKYPLGYDPLHERRC
jgi:hypothetical protein